MSAFNGRYVRKSRVYVEFGLIEIPLDKCGTALAFHFIRAGYAAVKDYIKQKERDEFEAIIASLYRDLLELKEGIQRDEKAKAEADNFQMCPLCATEIDLRLMGKYTFDPQSGMVKHVRCPTLKPKEERDI